MIRANSRSGIPRSVGHIEKQMTCCIWAWEVRAQCCPGLTDPQESFMEGRGNEILTRTWPHWKEVHTSTTAPATLNGNLSAHESFSLQAFSRWRTTSYAPEYLLCLTHGQVAELFLFPDHKLYFACKLPTSVCKVRFKGEYRDHEKRRRK